MILKRQRSILINWLIKQTTIANVIKSYFILKKLKGMPVQQWGIKIFHDILI